jgi:hypothetical protein
MAEYHGYPQGVPAPIGDGGVELLRKRRGDEQVTFKDVADHLSDYLKHHPSALRAIDGFARYVAEVENVAHDHDAVPKGSVASDGEPPDA